MESCLTCKVCCRFPERYSPLIPFFLDKEKGSYYGCRIDVVESIDGYICPYFLPDKNICSIYSKRPLDCKLYPFMVTYDDTYKKVILVLDNNCPYVKGFKFVDSIEISSPNIAFINDPQPNTVFVKELPELTEFVFGKTGRFRKLRIEDGHIIPYLWKDIMNILYDEETKDVYYNFKQFPKNDKDYIYLRKDLVELKGDKYKDKRNLCNYFQKNYSYKIQRFFPSNEHLILYRKWAEDKTNPYEKQLAEDSFFFHKRAFMDFNKLGLAGIEIWIDNKLSGYTFGFGLNKDTFTILGEIVEKKYKGINQFIFREFCEILSDNYIHINTMDDSEIEGLRKNKISYRPIHSGFPT